MHTSLYLITAPKLEGVDTIYDMQSCSKGKRMAKLHECSESFLSIVTQEISIPFTLAKKKSNDPNGVNRMNTIILFLREVENI